jgi:hypothetical protein
MFSVPDCEARLRAMPFAPFRFMTSSGESYEVHRPYLVIIGERDLIIGFDDADAPSIAKRTCRVAIAHITAMEDLPSPPAPSTKKKKRDAA